MEVPASASKSTTLPLPAVRCISWQSRRRAFRVCEQLTDLDCGSDQGSTLRAKPMAAERELRPLAARARLAGISRCSDHFSRQRFGSRLQTIPSPLLGHTYFCGL